jgi:hypothetical protein
VNLSRGLACLFVTLLLLLLRPVPFLHLTSSTFAHISAGTIPAPVSYGAPTLVGEPLEPCESEQTTPQAVILLPSDAWQARIRAAVPGETLLLRGGVFMASDLVSIPAGSAGHPITLKPYNCEAVTLYATLRPRSYNIIAGLHIETQGIADPNWIIRVDSKERGHIEQVIIRHNTLLGGYEDAIRLRGDVQRVLITGNHIDGGGVGHNIFVTAEDQPIAPSQIEISNNLLTKAYPPYANLLSEDMFQARDVGQILFAYNTCTNGLSMEQCVDIKSSQTPLWIMNNLFDGGNLQIIGNGEDGSDGCMVIHETDGKPENHQVGRNLFKNCKGAALRFASGDQAAGDPVEISRATLWENLLVSPDTTEGEILIFRAQQVEWNHNTVINGYLKLGDAAQVKSPQDTLFRNNIFVGTRIDDRTQPPASTYRCSNNLFYQTSGTGFVQQPCANSLTSDPLFVDPSTDNFQLDATTPARDQGDDGLTLGAYRVAFVEFDNLLYLPNIAKNW